jgi:hypothetical protein
MDVVAPPLGNCLNAKLRLEQLDSERNREAQKSEQANQRQFTPCLR